LRATGKKKKHHGTDTPKHKTRQSSAVSPAPKRMPDYLPYGLINHGLYCTLGLVSQF